jgi:tetratricopeptide (TPR) repeat protein
MKTAIENFQRAIELAPKFPEAHYYWGSMLLSLSDYKGALEHLDAAIELAPRAPHYRNTRADARRSTGDLKGAGNRVTRTAGLRTTSKRDRGRGRRFSRSRVERWIARARRHPRAIILECLGTRYKNINRRPPIKPQLKSNLFTFPWRPFRLRRLAPLALTVAMGAFAGEPTAEPLLRLETGMHTAEIRRIATDAAGRWAVTASKD